MTVCFLGVTEMNINIASPAFKDGAMIPKKYTCDGENISPPLKWDSIPAGTKSIALICEDPDAPAGLWVHWVIFNLPAECRELVENIPDDETLNDGSRQGITDFQTTGYGGPCPPWGTHRYMFKIYALDTMLDVVHLVDRETLLSLMKGHILAEGLLTGKYQRSK